MFTMFTEANEIASHRPDEGSWQSPLARPMTAYPSAGNLDDLVLEVVEGEMHALDLHTPFMTEEFLHTSKLHEGMCHAERERVVRSLKPTATFKMLSQIPRELVTTESVEGQDLRQRLLRGATIVFFCAGYRGKKFVFQRAAELGVKAVVIDSHDSWAAEMVEEGIIAKFIGIDMSANADSVFEQALSGVRSLKDDTIVGEADGVCTFIELAVPMVARLAETLGLPGAEPAVVDMARDKHATRAAIADYGMPAVANFLIRNSSELPAAGAHVGYPAVLKPIAGAASLGVQKVVDQEDMERTYHELVTLMSGLRVTSGALERVVKSDDSDNTSGVNADNVIALDMMLEEYLDGEEVDIDVVFDDGECHFCYVSDNGPTQEPYFGESWAVLPSLLEENKIQDLKSMAMDAVRALGFEQGVFHVEGKYTSRGPRLIEVNARMGGGPVRMIHKHVSGVDLVVEQMFLACGIPSRPVARDTGRSIGYGFVSAEKSGCVANTDFMAKFHDEPSVLQISTLIKSQDHVIGPEDGMPTWLAEVVVSCESGMAAKEEVQRLMVEIAKSCTEQTS